MVGNELESGFSRGGYRDILDLGKLGEVARHITQGGRGQAIRGLGIGLLITWAIASTGLNIVSWIAINQVDEVVTELQASVKELIKQERTH
jgi:hypothetical protein